ncbi:MAG: c-type cytochrome [Planctomycetaceae bacterium]
MNSVPGSFLVSMILTTSAIAALPTMAAADEDSVRPGLHGVVSDGQHSVSRIDRRLNFDWTASQIETRLKDAQSLKWSGNLLVRTGGPHTFYAQVTGTLKIVIDGNSALIAEGENHFATGTAIDLAAGEHQIQVEFRAPQQRSAGNVMDDLTLQLFWSSPEFTLEPLPADVLTHIPDMETANARHGRMLVDALRCAACHSGLGELPVLKAPDLRQLHGNTPEADIIRRLLQPASIGSWSSMPTFEFSEAEAADVAAFLTNDAQADDLRQREAPTWKEGDVDAGQKLLMTTGCAVCHALAQLPDGDVPMASPFHGPDLSDVAARRDAAWLLAWLKDPQSINAEHRMPVFKLSDDEQRQIVAALTTQAGADIAKPQSATTARSRDAAAVERGRALVAKSNCGSCHRIAGIQTPRTELPRPRSATASTQRHDCMTADGNTVRAVEKFPRFRLTELQRDQIRSWLETLKADLPVSTGYTRGELLLQRNGCIACHDRDQQTGVSTKTAAIEAMRDDLRGQSQALIPPPLTAVGDRLRDDTLRRAVAGEQKERRLPWLLVRMPRFTMSPEDREAIVNYLIGSDRIPESADSARQELFSHYDPRQPAVVTARELLIGNQLVGAGGFNCIACHSAGAYEPRNVALGTRGSDMMTIGQRVRPEYFFRWMRNPIRVVPGIEMPAIRKPVMGLSEASLSQQIAVLWKSLADPKFSPPTVVSRYEQLVTVSPGDRPYVIRDVFTIGGKKDHSNAARAFAIGFENGHSLLLDLDTMQLRQWTIGEFARQRTEGKSWYWDMAGVTLLQSHADGPFVQLMQQSSPDSPLLIPVIDEQRQAELLSYSIGANSVSLRVRFRFDPQKPDGKPDRALATHSPVTAWNDPTRPLIPVVVHLEFSPDKTQLAHPGWLWKLAVEDCPEQYELQFSGAVARQSRGEIPWTVQVTTTESDTLLPDSPRLKSNEALTIRYESEVVPSVLPPPSPVEQTSNADAITTVPGFQGQRLPVGTRIMPTGMAWMADGRMVITSLIGDVWVLSDTNGDKLPDAMALFATGLSAPYGVQVDGDAVLVAHKPEVLRLRDADGDGAADQFDVVASGWGFSENYHDWTTGLVRDHNGDLYVGLGSDYSQNKRPADNDRWRGTILRIDSNGAIVPLATALRFPMGLALDRRQNLFATDNQGVQNTFNEINHILPGKHYGVPSRHEEVTDDPSESPALMVPHPWTRSVNSILFLPDDFANPDLAGQGIACEYDTRCLIRFTVQEVSGVLQGACYRLSRPDQPGGGGNFVGPIASAVGPDGAIYIGSIWDSGWQGGTNTGSIERLVPDSKMPNGIREIRSTPEGFEITFFQPIRDKSAMCAAATWSVQGYTRHWNGSYATPDAERYSLSPRGLTLSDDCMRVNVRVEPLKAGFVYEIGIHESVAAEEGLWPAEGFYSMKAVP